MRNVRMFSLCGLTFLAVSALASAGTVHGIVAAKAKAVDPFTATPINLEQLHTQVLRASLEQELTAKQKAIEANKAAIRAIREKTLATPGAELNLTKGAQPAGQQQLRQLQAQVQSLQARFAAAIAAVHARQKAYNAPALIGITGSGSERTAIVRIGDSIHSFLPNTSFGQYRVGRVRHSSVMLYGPDGKEQLRLSPIKEIGIISNAAPMPTASQMGYSPTDNHPSGGSSAAIRSRLMQEAGGHMILPPRPGAF
ncbi:hypothetical protein HAQ00_02285 [Acidithiobacillus caldus ATCC 51756]|jgi:hypothetical protein|uniref:hypothetical protein n=1 Tax=Acidithiobacillus caldus TaxID=33059 RepID=UPI001C066902|nr:hypothetical protein [Acidithiobacillus caldus]MBU2734573.1 hypothetical protein [Acidithiobacillus caldus ATCC 51756]